MLMDRQRMGKHTHTSGGACSWSYGPYTHHTLTHVYICTCIHEHMYTYTHVCISTCIHLHMYTFIHAYINTCIHIHMLTYIYMYSRQQTTRSSVTVRMRNLASRNSVEDARSRSHTRKRSLTPSAAQQASERSPSNSQHPRKEGRKRCLWKMEGKREGERNPMSGKWV